MTIKKVVDPIKKRSYDFEISENTPSRKIVYFS